MPLYDNVGWQGGLISLVAYGLSFLEAILGYIFDVQGGFLWEITADGQLAVAGSSVPGLTPKGEDIVGALMTIIHNGIVAAAQFVTLLPMNVAP